MAKSHRSKILGAGFIAACLLIVGIGIGAYWNTHQLVRSFGSVSSSHQTIEKLQSIQELVQTAESSAYNYVITGRPEALKVYSRVTVQIPKRLGEVEPQLKNNVRQARALKQFRQLYAIHQQYLSKIVTAREESGFEAAAQWVSAEDDHAIRDVLHNLLNEVESEQTQVLRKRTASSSAHTADVKFSILSAIGVIFVLVAGMFGWLRRESGERQAVESTNERLETFLRSIVQRTPYLVTVKEAETLRLTLVNQAATEWLGHTEAELLGSNEYDLRPPEAAQLAMEQDRHALQLGEPVDIPEEVLVRDGKEERILHTQKVAIPDENGLPAYLLTISEDITQRRQAERMLELSRDAAIQSERIKAEFIRNMSHEIRTPLSIVIGMNSILLDSNLTPEQRGIAVKVETAASGLAKLSKSILDFSKIEAGTFTLEMKELNLKQNIEGIVSMLNEQAKTKGIGLVSLIPPSVPQTLMGDPARLRQVLTELVGNALKFTERGEVIIRVSEAEPINDQIWFTIKVSDTGLGIDEETQKHVFDPFRQGDGSYTRRFGGTGLGLAVSKSIVELMGGQIGFTSAPHEGSTFWCRIPFKKRAMAGHVANLVTGPWTKARILVIDEDEASRQGLREQLKAWSLASEGAPSGDTALQMLRSEHKAGRPFKIVMLDMHLTDMEGIAFSWAVKRDPALAGVRLLVLTQAEIELSTANSLGFAAVVSKPPIPETLYTELTRLIETSDQGNRFTA